MGVSELGLYRDAPKQADLDRCVHCGLCLNACPTYRELRVEMDSPRGRIYQMVQVNNGAPITDSYREHIDLCLACRACETACPSGVQYGRLVEAARAQIAKSVQKPWHVRTMEKFVFERLLPSPLLLQWSAFFLKAYEASGLQGWVRSSGLLRRFGRLQEVEALSPPVEMPSFFRQYGQVFPAERADDPKYKVALLGGCIANISFTRLNEATVRVLQKNGCEVHVPAAQTCCGALALHAGHRRQARIQARQNIDALLAGNYDAIITNAAGCGSTLKEYDELLEEDPQYREKGREFVKRMKDVTEFLAAIDLNTNMGPVNTRVTYQDSCHLAHGQKIRTAPRKLLASVPGLKLQEMPMADLCCGSAGIYNVVQNEMSMAILEKKMTYVNAVDPDVIVTANPGCMIQLRAGAKKHGRGQPVLHVVEILDAAYRAAGPKIPANN